MIQRQTCAPVSSCNLYRRFLNQYIFVSDQERCQNGTKGFFSFYFKMIMKVCRALPNYIYSYIAYLLVFFFFFYFSQTTFRLPTLITLNSDVLPLNLAAFIKKVTRFVGKIFFLFNFRNRF